jgi:MFS family permease
LYAGTFLTELLFIAAIIVPFLSVLGLSMEEILITEAIYSLAILIAEVPSGYFADRVGRKISIILGALFWIIGISFYAFFGGFFWISIGALFWGIGSSFNSGANEAMLYETLMQLGREKEYKKVQGNIFFYGRIAAVIGSVSAGFMAAGDLKIPAYATLLAVIVWFFLSLSLKETRHELEEKEAWQHFKRILKESLLHDKQLRYFLLFTAIGGFFAIEFWLAQKYWGFLGVSIVYFGLLVAGMNIFSAFASKYAKEIENKIGEKEALLVIPIVPIIVWFIFANVSVLWIIPLFFITTGLRGFMVPVFNDFIQKHSTFDRRATIMSVKSLLEKMVFFVFAPLLGAVTDVYSIQTAFLIIAGILAVFAAASLFTLRRVKII